MKKLIILLLFVVLAMTGFIARAAQNPKIATGEHRVDSNLEHRCAYLYGVGNMLGIERAMAGDDDQSMRGRSVVPVLLEGLTGVFYRDPQSVFREEILFLHSGTNA